ncbi:MAG: hypothetical protein GY765_17645 [bacterium]|nr:hypothetical protein [bacterium]
MKKFIIGVFIFALLAHIASAGENENSMASFMGQKWGVDAKVFKRTFIYKKKLVTRGGGAFDLVDFKIGDVSTDYIRFNFVPKIKGKKLRFKKKHFAKFYLDSVKIRLHHYSFPYLVNIFKVKYGKPVKDSIDEGVYDQIWRYKSVDVIWANETIKRKIRMQCSTYTKPSKEDHNYARVSLTEITPEPDRELRKKQEEKKKKEAAAIL